MWGRLCVILALIAVGAAPPATVAPGIAAALRALVASDLRVATVAFRLQTAAAARGACASRTALPGLLVGDASQYRADLRPGMALLFGLAERPAITGIVPGSPAAAADIRVGDQLVQLDGNDLDEGAPRARVGRAARGERFTRLVALLADAFARGPVTLGLRRGDAALSRTITGAPACASMVQLDLGGLRNADADGRTVTISQGLLDAVRNDDELALVIGHELSHNILGHRALLDRAGRGGLFGARAQVRETERAADYLGLYLVAWGGYDVETAAALWRHFGRGGRWGSLVAGSHPATADRARDLEAEAAQIRARQAAGAPVMPDPAMLD